MPTLSMDVKTSYTVPMRLLSRLKDSHIRAIITAIPVVLLVYLFARYFAFTGTYIVRYDFHDKSPIVSDFGPRGRTLDREMNLESGESYQRIVGEPVYMDVDVPRSFDTVDIDVSYDNEDQPFIELGIVNSGTPWSVSLYPFENRVLDQAQKEWSRIDGPDGLVLLQRDATVGSVEDFLVNPPMDKQIGVYHYNFAVSYYDTEYTPTTAPLVIERQLRGSHTFLTYVKDETLHADLTFVDLNATEDVDMVTVDVYNLDNELLLQQTLADDGVIDDSNTVSSFQTLTLDLPGLTEGVYSIVVTGTNDTVVTRISTLQHQFVAKGHVSVMNSAASATILSGTDTAPTTLWYSANKVVARARNTESVQTISIDQDQLSLTKIQSPHVWVRSDTATAPFHTIVTPKNDVTLDGKGVFGFTEESYFNPNGPIVPMDDATQLEELDAILFTDYATPDGADEKGNAIKTQSIALSLTGVQGDRKHLQFLVSAPGIAYNHATIRFHSVQFIFHREALLKRLWKRFFS